VKHSRCTEPHAPRRRATEAEISEVQAHLAAAVKVAQKGALLAGAERRHSEGRRIRRFATRPIAFGARFDEVQS
jgi:hypothetical protein